jgi:hypothetical protein
MRRNPVTPLSGSNVTLYGTVGMFNGNGVLKVVEKLAVLP